jgi:DHA1 family multidrug resistance protein-like MFS transporter
MSMETRRQLAVLMTAMFVYMIGFGIIMPITPFYSKSLGATALDLGLLMASYSLMQFLFAPLWGRLSDRFGRRPIIVAGLVGLGVSFILFGLSTSLWMLFLARILGGVLSSGIFPASLAYIADVTSKKERGQAMGLLGAASGLGIIFGPAVSGFIAVLGLSMPFFAAGLLSLATAGFALALLPESMKQKSPKIVIPTPVEAARTFVVSLLSPLKLAIGVFFITTMIITFAIAGFESTFTYYAMDRYGVTDQISPMPVLGGTVSVTGPMVIAMVFVVMGIIGVICQGVLVNKAIERFTEEITIVFGLIFCGAGLIMVIFASELASLLFATGLLSIGSGFVNPALNTLISKRTPPERQGAVMGILGSYNSLGRIAGPPFGGLLYGVSMFLPNAFSGLVMAAGAVWVYVVARMSGKEKVAIAPELQIKN